MNSPYFFSSLDRRPDFVDSAQLHPRMETPPVWADLEREEPVEYPPGEWVWSAIALILILAVCATFPGPWFQS